MIFQANHLELLSGNKGKRTMPKDNFSAKLISIEESIQHFKKTNNGTLYHNPNFINFVQDNVLWIGGFKQNTLLCTMPIFNNLMPEFFYYSGPLWNEEIFRLKPYRRFSTSQKVYEKMIGYSLDIRSNLSIQFPSTNYDIRAFDWWNYNSEEKYRFKINVRYTAKLKNLQSQTIEQLKSNLRSDDKRKRLSRVLRNKNQFKLDNNISSEKFLDLYKQTMARNNAKVPDSELKTLKKFFLYAKDEGKGFVLNLTDANTNEVIGAQLVIYEKEVANAIAHGIDQRFYSSEKITYLIFNSILLAKSDGMEVFDFNGANSPNRADDKHSYGADEVPFYCLEY